MSSNCFAKGNFTRQIQQRTTINYQSSYGRDQTCGMLFGILAQNSYILRDTTEHEHAFRPSSRVDVCMNARQMLFALAGKPMTTATGAGKCLLILYCIPLLTAIQWTTAEG